MTATAAGSLTSDTERQLRTLHGRGVCAQTAAASLQQAGMRRVVLDGNDIAAILDVSGWGLVGADRSRPAEVPQLDRSLLDGMIVSCP